MNMLLKFGIALLVTASVIMVPARAGPGWVLAFQNNKESFYFSPDSVETTNDLTQVAVVRNLHQPQNTTSGKFSSVYETLSIHCKSLRVTSKDTLFFKREFARGERLELNQKDRRLVPALGQNLPPLLLMHVCGFGA